MKIITNYYTYSVRQTARRLGHFSFAPLVAFSARPFSFAPLATFSARPYFFTVRIFLSARPYSFSVHLSARSNPIFFAALSFFGAGLFCRVFLLPRGPFFAAAFSFDTGLFSPSLSHSDMPKEPFKKMPKGAAQIRAAPFPDFYKTFDCFSAKYGPSPQSPSCVTTYVHLKFLPTTNTSHLSARARLFRSGGQRRKE